MLASYDHSNTINLFALGALVAWLRGEVARDGTVAPGPRLPAPDLALAQARLGGDVAPETWALVLRLNRFGDEPQPLILASMYRHLAHAPAFLQRVEARPGAGRTPTARCERAIVGNRQAAAERSSRIARAISTQSGRCWPPRSKQACRPVRRPRHRQDGHHLPRDPRGAGHPSS